MLSGTRTSRGAPFTVARLTDGTLAAWGFNGYGQCNIPPVPAGLRWVRVAAGNTHAVKHRQQQSTRGQHGDRLADEDPAGICFRDQRVRRAPGAGAVCRDSAQHAGSVLVAGVLGGPQQPHAPTVDDVQYGVLFRPAGVVG